MAPQIIIIVLITFGLAINLVRHGEPNGRYNFWIQLLSAAITILLLNWGGFFDVFKGN